MFTVILETQFKAKHSVVMRDGSIEPEHEHFWAVTVEVSSDKLDKRGMAIDFAQLKARLNDILSQLAGASLNEIDYFHENNATAESVSKYIYDRLEPNLPNGVRLDGITVSEQVGCAARYRKNRDSMADNLGRVV